MSAPSIFECCDICAALLTAEELSADTPPGYDALCDGCNRDVDAGRSHYRRGPGLAYLLHPDDPEHPENQS